MVLRLRSAYEGDASTTLSIRASTTLSIRASTALSIRGEGDGGGMDCPKISTAGGGWGERKSVNKAPNLETTTNNILITFLQ